MRGKAVPAVAYMWSICLGKRFVYPSTSRAFSNQILKSPSLLSIDIVDSWSSAPKQPCQPCFQEWRLTNRFIEFGVGSEPSVSAELEIQIHFCSFMTAKNQSAKIIDGKAIADGIRSRIASEVSRMKESIGQVPGLAVILVGQRRDSQIYVRNKISASEEVGIKYKMTSLPENCTECEVCDALCRFNEDPSVHGILVQLPLPPHLEEAKILSLISLQKDVDGFDPLNIGKLAMQGTEPLFIPCTPKGCIELLLQSGVDITGKKAVVIGRSNIVGLPTSLLLQRHHATVTILHPFTKNPEKIACEADILVAAAGVPNLVRGSWVKPGAVIVDVGTNPIEDPTSEYGYHLIGDVCFDEAKRIASAITPVPGGVGPVTVAMLLYNTLESAKRAFAFT